MLRGMLPVNTDTLRLFLHVLAATVWVGGQLTLAGLVPGLRALGPDVPRTVVRRFNRIAWPAFGVLFVTGLWNLSETNFGQQTTAWQATLFAKLVIVALAGVSAALHTHASSRKAVAIWGALSGLTSLLALFYGVQLHG
ncbi:MAG: CopD family protein [Actinomycetota bacterium]|jgi:putative copper export protein